MGANLMVGSQNGYCHETSQCLLALAENAALLHDQIAEALNTKVMTFANLEVLADTVKYLENGLDIMAMHMDDHIAEMDDGS